MLGTVLTHLVQKVGSLTSNVTTYLTKKLYELLGVLNALKTQLAALCSQLVSAVQKVKVLLVQCITLVLSIKVVLTNALAKVGVTGQPSVTTAPPTLQPVKRQRKKGKQRVKMDTQAK